jgi:hypothetical protein
MSTNANNNGSNDAMTTEDAEDFISRFNSKIDPVAEKISKQIVAEVVRKTMDTVTLHDAMKSILEEALINALSKPVKEVVLGTLTGKMLEAVISSLTKMALE